MNIFNRKMLLSVSIAWFALLLISCGANSSPEGRMNIKTENLRQEMLDSMRKQNQAVLDTLARMREEIKSIKQGIK